MGKDFHLSCFKCQVSFQVLWLFSSDLSIRFVSWYWTVGSGGGSAGLGVRSCFARGRQVYLYVHFYSFYCDCRCYNKRKDENWIHLYKLTLVIPCKVLRFWNIKKHVIAWLIFLLAVLINLLLDSLIAILLFQLQFFPTTAMVCTFAFLIWFMFVHISLMDIVSSKCIFPLMSK